MPMWKDLLELIVAVVVILAKDEGTKGGTEK